LIQTSGTPIIAPKINTLYIIKESLTLTLIRVYFLALKNLEMSKICSIMEAFQSLLYSLLSVTSSPFLSAHSGFVILIMWLFQAVKSTKLLLCH